MSDSNQDFHLSEMEMDQLMLRLQCATVVDEERLRQVLQMMSSSNNNSNSSSAFATNQMIQELERSMAEDDEVDEWPLVMDTSGWLV